MCCIHMCAGSRSGGGGYFHQNSMWMCLLDLENLPCSIPIFLPNYPPISIPFSKEKHPILTKLGALYNNLPKIHPIYVIWAPSSLMKTPPIALPTFAQKAYVYHVNMRPPPPPPCRPTARINFGRCRTPLKWMFLYPKCGLFEPRFLNFLKAFL